MTTITITNARKNFFKIAEDCIKYNDPVNISTKNGNIVVMSEEEYRGLMETLYLSSIPGMKESLLEAKNTPLEECEEINIDDL